MDTGFSPCIILHALRDENCDVSLLSCEFFCLNLTLGYCAQDVPNEKSEKRIANGEEEEASKNAFFRCAPRIKSRFYISPKARLNWLK